MEKKRFFVGVLAMVLVFSMAFVGCENGSTDDDDGGGNYSLDGTRWEQTTGAGIPTGGLRVTFNSPNFECKGITDGTVYSSGTYTVSGNSFTGTITGGLAGSGTFSGTISGNTLTYTSIAGGGQTATGTMTKK
jgi:hypothetical protein